MAAAADMGHMSPALQEFFKSESTAAMQERAAVGDLLEEGSDLNLGDLDITTAQISLAGVEDQLEHFVNHEVLKAILDQGCDPKEYGQQYETKLRQAELESIQDYITESDNLVELHEQVRYSLQYMADDFCSAAFVKTLQSREQGMCCHSDSIHCIICNTGLQQQVTLCGAV